MPMLVFTFTDIHIHLSSCITFLFTIYYLASIIPLCEPILHLQMCLVRVVLHWWNSAVIHVNYTAYGPIFVGPHLKVSALGGCFTAGVPPTIWQGLTNWTFWNSGYWNILISIAFFFYLMSEVFTLVELPGVVLCYLIYVYSPMRNPSRWKLWLEFAQFPLTLVY